MTQEQLNVILEKHKKWLNGEEGGKCADLSCANLSDADLSNANLSDADLRGADLRHTNLIYANLSDADLRGANLSGSNLSYVCLNGADLNGANLRGANLRGANLSGSNLNGANLSDTILNEKEKIRKGICLAEKMVGYKKCKDDVIIKLEMPKGAIVFSINNNKCRTNIAKCVEISGGLKQAVSGFDGKFIYKVGETYTITDFDCQYNIECSEGIHFFRTKEGAEKYEN